MPTKTGEGTTNQITNKKCLCFLAAFDPEGRWRARPSNELQVEKSRVAGCNSVASGCLLSAEYWQDETPAQIAAATEENEDSLIRIYFVGPVARI